jgi:hypothetical protein
MAAMPQFPRLRIKQTAKKESRQINAMSRVRQNFLKTYPVTN